MNKAIYFVIGTGIIGGFVHANGESLLKATSFPKTFNDAPFITRMEVLSDGYADVETIYDENGRCISGCAYAGITIEDETLAMERNTRSAYYAATTQHDVENNTTESQTQPETNNQIPTQSGTNQGGQSQTQPVQNQPSTSSHPTSQPPTIQITPPIQHQTPNSQNKYIPSRSPIGSDILVSSDFGPRRAPTAGATSWHKGIDISIPIGTSIFATADGTIEYIQDQGNKGGGKYVVVKHGNSNFRTAYMHLSDNKVRRVGDSVHVGDLIGISGNTGVSTGPHLHYTIYYTEPNKKFAWSADAIDPVWPLNYFDMGYRFKNQSVKSCLHTPRNFCGSQSTTPDKIPTDPLPGEIK